MFSLKRFRSSERVDDGPAMSDDRDIRAFAFDVGDTQRDHKISIGGIRNFARISVEQGVLHEIDRIIVTDGGFD